MFVQKYRRNRTFNSVSQGPTTLLYVYTGRKQCVIKLRVFLQKINACADARKLRIASGRYKRIFTRANRKNIIFRVFGGLISEELNEN